MKIITFLVLTIVPFVVGYLMGFSKGGKLLIHLVNLMKNMGMSDIEIKAILKEAKKDKYENKEE